MAPHEEDGDMVFSSCALEREVKGGGRVVASGRTIQEQACVSFQWGGVQLDCASPDN